MDERTVQMKRLKKEYMKQRRKSVWVWNALLILMLVLLAVAAACCAYMVFYRAPLVRRLDDLIWTPLKNLVGLTMNLRAVGAFVIHYGLYFVTGFSILFVAVLILRACAVAKTKKWDSYLDYKTMKTTLKTEKQEAKF